MEKTGQQTMTTLRMYWKLFEKAIVYKQDESIGNNAGKQHYVMYY